jgi:dihydrofolate synthase / folylpolyglutamate synthase
MQHHFPSIDYVMSLTPSGMQEGRDNVLKLMDILWNPQDTLRVFHVTGSNGKWSVCQMLSQVLWKSFWKKVGLFTSPHFITINERFQINGTPIADDTLEKYYEQVIQLGKKHDIPLSFFEIQVVVMVLYFCDEKVEYAVVEVGLGGTYDGTNIFKKPLACFITSITLEHTHVLGKTRTSILKNKLGIIKSGTHLYTPLKNKLIETTCRENTVSLHTLRKDQRQNTNLIWNHQQKNSGIVFEALKDQWFEEKKILSWLQNIYNPWRFEWIAPHILVDTANNRENVWILKKMIQKLNLKKTIVLYGTTQTDSDEAKELAQMLPANRRILVDDFCERALPCTEYNNWFDFDETIHLFEEVEKVRKILTNQHNTIIIYGSFYLVWEIMILSRYKPFAMG